MNTSLLSLVLKYNDEYSKNLWPSTLFGLLCLVIGLFGNGYVLFIYKFRMKDKTESRYFIPYLAMADLCASFFTCITFTLLNFYPLYFPWDFWCKGMAFLSFVPGLASALFLLAIAVQRYTRSRPLERHFSLFWRRATVGIILTVSLVMGIPCLLFAGVGEIEFVYNGNNVTSINCRQRGNQYMELAPVFYGVLAVVLSVNIVCIFILYICIATVVYRRNKGTRLSKSLASSNGHKERTTKTEDTELDAIEILSRNANAKKSRDLFKEGTSRNVGKFTTSSPSTQFNKMFLTIVVAYVLTFLPAGIVLVTFVSKENIDSAVIFLGFPMWQMQMYSILQRTWVINNIVNPFIYGYFDMEFRKYLKNIVPPFCRCKV